MSPYISLPGERDQQTACPGYVIDNGFLFLPDHHTFQLLFRRQTYRLFAFFAFFSRRFSFNVFSGFFFTAFFASLPLAIYRSYVYASLKLNVWYENRSCNITALCNVQGDWMGSAARTAIWTRAEQNSAFCPFFQINKKAPDREPQLLNQ